MSTFVLRNIRLRDNLALLSFTELSLLWVAKIVNSFLELEGNIIILSCTVIDAGMLSLSQPRVIIQDAPIQFLV